jgi:integrase
VSFRNGPERSRRLRESAQTTNKTAAVKFLNHRKAESDACRIVATEATVGTLLDNLLADYRRHKRASIKALVSYVQKHVRPGLGRIPAAELTTGHLSRYIEQRQREGASNSSINHELKAVRRAFAIGRESTPPLAFSIPKIELLDESGAVRSGFVEHSEYVKLRDALPRHQRPLLVIGYHLGLRRGEILKLRWDQVDWAAGVIRLETQQTKGRKPRTAPLYGDLRAELEAAERGKSPFIVQWAATASAN